MKETETTAIFFRALIMEIMENSALKKRNKRLTDENKELRAKLNDVELELAREGGKSDFEKIQSGHADVGHHAYVD